jgi:hypothetical protein
LRVQELNRFRKTAREENSLVALKLLSPDGEKAWPVMHKLSQALSDIEVDCSVVECEGEPCLFVNLQDEFAATCRLKNFGVAMPNLLRPQPILTVSLAPEAGGYTPAVAR